MPRENFSPLSLPVVHDVVEGDDERRQKGQIASGEGITVGFKADEKVELFKGEGADRSTISYFITRNQLQDEPHLGENKSPNHESTRKLDLLPSDSHAQLRNNISNYSVVCILGMLCRSYLQYFLQKSSRACLLRLQ